MVFWCGKGKIKTKVELIFVKVVRIYGSFFFSSARDGREKDYQTSERSIDILYFCLFFRSLGHCPLHVKSRIRQENQKIISSAYSTASIFGSIQAQTKEESSPLQRPICIISGLLWRVTFTANSRVHRVGRASGITSAPHLQFKARLKLSSLMQLHRITPTLALAACTSCPCNWRQKEERNRTEKKRKLSRS